MGIGPLYGFQVQPGFDLAFCFGFSLDVLIKQAEDRRLEFALEDETRKLLPTAVYEFTLKQVSPDQLIAVLNQRLSLDQVLLGERRLIRLLQ